MRRKAGLAGLAVRRPSFAGEGGRGGRLSLLRRGGRLSRLEHPGPGSPGLAGSTRTLVPDLCIDLAGSSANLIPRVTAIRTSPDLQWLVRPTEVFLAAPSHKIPPPIRSSSGLDGGYPMKTMAGGRTQGVGRKGKVEQMDTWVGSMPW
ncbi:protein c-Fos-like [Lagenorhynchus albirostris]|uniref:protein c-Fos-like n=1 Tax=Lagenorhynchus albirostris TaxID=27610 RepID=UPI0028EC2DC0|nr:protein c-Fos-like [Lagenorhynchus albirostris]